MEKVINVQAPAKHIVGLLPADPPQCRVETAPSRAEQLQLDPPHRVSPRAGNRPVRTQGARSHCDAV